ncbi:MAG TPA: PBS lyase, partial [Myxococcaceae bacterium]|nr:PBS lyase [Myxococcaceae bacterium]
MDPSASASWVRRIWPLAAFQVTFIAGATQLKSVGNALVLARMDATVLPYLYLVGAIVVGVLAVVPRPVPGAPGSAPARSAAVGACLTALLGVGALLQLTSIPIAVYLLAEVGTTFVALRLWLQAGARFDAREARRAFPMLNAAAMGGGIVGGLLLQGGAGRIGLTWVLVEAAAFLALSAWLWRYALPLPPPRQVVGGTHRPRHRWRHLGREPYIQLLGVLVLSLAVLSTFADYLFRMRAGEALEEVALAALFGQLQVWLSLFCLVFQLVFAERLLERLGVLRYLALIPVVLTPL